MSEIELKPCPFCGSTVEQLNGIEFRCVSCGVLTIFLVGDDSKVVDRWNTRTPTPPQKQEGRKAIFEKAKQGSWVGEVLTIMFEKP